MNNTQKKEGSDVLQASTDVGSCIVSESTLPEAVHIPLKIANRALRDIKSILRQIRRFTNMPFEELKAYLQAHPRDTFCEIPHPNGGHLYCGRIGWTKLGALTELCLNLDPRLRRRIRHNQALKAVIDSFVSLFSQTSCALNEVSAGQLLQDSLRKLRLSLVVTEHYVPCVLFPDGPLSEFSIGPVTFTRRRQFFKNKKAEFRRSAEMNTAAHIEFINAKVAQGFPRDRMLNKKESRRLVRNLQARSIRIYRDYPWVASVKVIDCDSETSKAHALESVNMALNVIRVLLGADATRKLRSAWSQSNTLKKAHLHADSNGIISSSLSSESDAPVGVINWDKALHRANWELAILGSALNSIVDPKEISPLSQRLLDAVHWYGDAVMDSNPPASIIKYITVIERLFFGAYNQGHTKNFALRVSSVLDAFDCNSDNRAQEHATTIYQARSSLLHGAGSPTLDASYEHLRVAAELSRLCILCSAQIYPMMSSAFDNPDPAKLEETMKRICNEGTDWLAEAAGYNKR
ncbi:hypothetical protein ACLO87_14095 [Paenalcaligenes sp. Me52]|uniref:hypothetical protein n=1 Tax=Paenalcaligenes sp. Me52 TaxID=3392038 RepID=UPI003D2CEA4A